MRRHKSREQKMRIVLITCLCWVGLLLAPYAAAQDTVDTEKAPATDSDGVGPGQGEKGKGQNETTGTQTWGGGPKSGKLQEEWLKWIMDIKDAPPGYIPVPPGTKPKPKDPLECARVLVFYYENSDELQDASKEMKAHMEGPCLPGG